MKHKHADVFGEDKIANGLLISAAPDMLNVLQFLVETAKSEGDQSVGIDWAKAAIEKALGVESSTGTIAKALGEE